jgi:hypothetical protein
VAAEHLDDAVPHHHVCTRLQDVNLLCATKPGQARLSVATPRNNCK